MIENGQERERESKKTFAGVLACNETAERGGARTN